MNVTVPVASTAPDVATDTSHAPDVAPEPHHSRHQAKVAREETRLAAVVASAGDNPSHSPSVVKAGGAVVSDCAHRPSVVKAGRVAMADDGPSCPTA